MAKAKEFAKVETVGEGGDTVAAPEKLAEIAALRAKREALSISIERDREKVKALSEQIRDLEGPVPDNKPVRTSFKMKKAE